jgi:hypothetical protein
MKFLDKINIVSLMVFACMYMCQVDIPCMIWNFDEMIMLCCRIIFITWRDLEFKNIFLILGISQD